MPFISSSEAKNAYFMSGEATNEIYIIMLHERIYRWHIHSKFFNFLYIILYTILSVTIFCTKSRHTRSHITSY